MSMDILISKGIDVPSLKIMSTLTAAKELVLPSEGNIVLKKLSKIYQKYETEIDIPGVIKDVKEFKLIFENIFKSPLFDRDGLETELLVYCEHFSMKCFYDSAPFEEAFSKACELGSISALKHLWNILKKSRLYAIFFSHTDFWGIFEKNLSLAAKMGQTDIVRILLTESFKINRMDHFGKTALMLAAENNHLEIVNLLLEKNADIDIVNENSETALMLAAKNGHTKIVKRLLDKNANFSIIEKLFGRNALMIAAQMGHKEIITLLRNKFASIHVFDKIGKTASILAEENNHKDIVEMLLG